MNVNICFWKTKAASTTTTIIETTQMATFGKRPIGFLHELAFCMIIFQSQDLSAFYSTDPFI